MKRLVLLAMLLPTSAWAFPLPDAQAVEDAQTVELPTALVGRAIQSLVAEGGTTAILIAKAIQECMQASGPTSVKINGMSAACPVVTKARDDRAAERKRAIDDAVKAREGGAP